MKNYKFYKKNIRKLIIIITSLFVITFIILYHLPIKKIVNMNACSLDGQIGNVYIEIRFHRSFFAPTVTTGKIIFNKIEYVGITERVPDFFKNDFFSNIKLKFDDFRYYYFVNSSLIAPDYIYDTIRLLEMSDTNYDLEKLSFIHDNAKIGETSVYYAPATTPEEAREIYKYFSKKYKYQ